VRALRAATALLLIALPAAAEEAKTVEGVSASAKPGELYQTVPTKKSRADLSQFLVKPAQKAVKARDWAKAIPLYQALAVARGPGSPEQKQVATLWTLAGQNEDAAEAWATYAGSATDPKE
jgi:hypothetical protein